AERREKVAPVFGPTDYGEYLLRIWYQARDAEFFDPWYAATPQTVIPRQGSYDLEWVNARALDLLRAGEAARPFAHAALDFDLNAALKAVSAPKTLVALAGPAGRSRAERAAAGADAQIVEAPFAASDHADLVAGLLS
ncbi:MAG: hypothetical protein AAGL49_03430, partial [Pseudomonadota bacterium]